MRNLEEMIEQVTRHVIERQRAIVARNGKPISADLLEVFERTRQIFEEDLADLLKRNHGHFTAKRADGTEEINRLTTGL